MQTSRHMRRALRAAALGVLALAAQGRAELATDRLAATNGVRQTDVSGTNYFMGRVSIGTATLSEALALSGRIKVHDPIILGSSWLSNDGGDEGLRVSSNGTVAINAAAGADGLLVWEASVDVDTRNGIYWSRSATTTTNATPHDVGFDLVAVPVLGAGLTNGSEWIGAEVALLGGTGFVGRLARLEAFLVQYGAYSSGASVVSGSIDESAGVVLKPTLDGGLVTDMHGLVIEAPSGTNMTGVRYPLYVAWSKPSYLAGNVGLGTTNPSATLHVAGDGRITAGIPFTTNLGDIAMGSTNYPAWWGSRGVVASNAVPTNQYAAVNAGQVKWIATNAYDDLQARLSAWGGAGSAVQSLVFGFSASNNWQAANLGQLKAVAQPFHDRLIALGYTNAYPWTSTTSDDRDFAAATIGQLKRLFDWNLPSTDSDADGLPDWAETGSGLYLGPANTGSSASDADSDDDGVNDGAEVAARTDPSSADRTAPHVVLTSPGGYLLRRLP